jgi:ATP-binding cassette subfamily B (MDR/TAP) protein 1
MSSSSAADPEEIRMRVVILGASHAGAADEWVRPELEAFHLPPRRRRLP